MGVKLLCDCVLLAANIWTAKYLKHLHIFLTINLYIIPCAVYPRSFLLFCFNRIWRTGKTTSICVMRWAVLITKPSALLQHDNMYAGKNVENRVKSQKKRDEYFIGKKFFDNGVQIRHRSGCLRSWGQMKCRIWTLPTHQINDFRLVFLCSCFCVHSCWFVRQKTICRINGSKSLRKCCVTKRTATSNSRTAGIFMWIV